MKKEITGIVFDIQSFSTHDGPGIRTNIFLKGCPLRCLWCANPEGQQFCPEIFYTKENCQGCYKCVAGCSESAISINKNEPLKNGYITIDRNKCKTCQTFDCIKSCYNGALAITGKVMSVSDVMKVVMRDQPFYRKYGGVTLSGGDPLAQADFALEILKSCKAKYINTAMETELCVPFESIEKVFPYVDYFLCDLKVMDYEKHKKATGINNENILNNLAKMAKLDASKILIRVPIIPEYTDSEDNIHRIGKFCKENNLKRVNILPYHKLGAMKFEKLGLPYLMPDCSPPSSEKMLLLQNIIKSYEVECIIN